MAIRLLTSAGDLALYEAWIKQHPQGTLWQSLEWKKYQEALGRSVLLYAVTSDRLPVTGSEDDIAASAMIVVDKTTGGFSTWDIQRGPLLASSFQLSASEEFFDVILKDAKQDKCLSVFLSPVKKLEARSYRLTSSVRHEQPEATRILDLTVPEEEILKQMHQKGRYNIKVAEKNGIRIEKSHDVEAYAKLASDTAKRDGFSGGSVRRYKTFLEKIPGSFLLLAYTADHQSPVAGLIGVVHGKTGIYYYGASDYAHRALMAPYLLQWDAIKRCKKAGCERYDLLGIAPPTNSPITDDRSPILHRWSGISDFKAKFGGTVIAYPVEQEVVLKPAVKMLLQMKRKVMG